MIIEPAKIINDYIDRNRRQYVIPVYQRNYEWPEEQCVKLFEDIVEAGKKDKIHFCGSIVASSVGEKNGIDTYIIIDGQQRLTTIYILLKALLDCAENDREKEAIEEWLFNKNRMEDYDIDVASKLKLKPIKSDNIQLLLLMEDKKEEIDHNSGIWQNYEVFCGLIQEQLQRGLYVKDIYKGVEKLTCAKINLDPSDNAQEIFERINSTGVPLSLQDKIRNFVLMTDQNQERLYEDYWIKIENSITKSQMTPFFMDYMNSKVDGFIKEKDAYETFKGLYRIKKYDNESILKELLKYAGYYHTFLYGDDRYNDKINYYLLSLAQLKQTTVYLFLFSVFEDYDNKIIDEKELEKVLQFLLAYGIRRIICEVGSNSLRGLYKTLYNRVYSKENAKEHYYDALISFMKQITSKDALPSDEEFSNALLYNNLYRKNALCKYLLSAIENDGKEKVVVDNLTIEHILPQNENLSDSWKDMLGDDWMEVRNKYLHTLGNLTLTGYNSELGDKSFIEKKELLENADSKMVVLYKEVKDCVEWNEYTISYRAEVLKNKIFELYPIVEPEEEISFYEPGFNEYTCEDPTLATYKEPNYFIIQGEKIKCSSFAELLKLLIVELYDIDSSIIERMAINNEKIVSWSSNVMFSYDSNIVSGTQNFKIKGTNIYESTGFSASHIMYIVKALLERYEIEMNDFVYSAKVNNKE